MQFLGTKRTIPERVLNSLASHHHRQNIASACSTSSSRRHTKWRTLLPIRDITEQNGQPNNRKDYKRQQLQDGVALRKTAALQGKLLEPLRSSCLLNDGEHVLLLNGGGGGERRSSSSSNGLLWNNWDGQLIWIAARRRSDYVKDYRWRTSEFGDARGASKLGRRYRSNHDDRGRRKPSRSEAVAKANSWEVEGQRNNYNNGYDAILVLAGGQVAGGGVPVWVERRLDKALDLQQRSNSKNNGGAVCKIVCLGGGTPHMAPILSSDGFVIHESTSCAEYLHSKGAPFAHLIKEWASYDTIGNGYFSLTQHVIPRRWKTLAVVTSEFHMPRTRAVFEWIFGLQGAGLALQQKGQELGFVDGAVAAATGSKGQGFDLEFHSVPDHGDLDESIAQARLERERNSIRNLNMLSQRIHNLEDFHEWFHTEHKAYNTEDQDLFGKEDKDDPARQSY